jgi:N-acetylglutamate synthase-like GNAT family acetyltransferase
MKIINYKPKYAKYFDTLNRIWIKKYFNVEAIDEFMLTQPKDAILDKGGKILFVEHDKKIIGTVALLPINKTDVELIKMGVDEKHQGLGAGKMLFNGAVDAAKEMGFEKIIIYSNKKLDAALSIYVKGGFKEIPIESGVYYDRCDIKMELPI